MTYRVPITHVHDKIRRHPIRVIFLNFGPNSRLTRPRSLVVTYLAACQTHAGFAHAMRTAQVQLQRVGSRVARQFSQCCPIGFAVRAHDTGDQYLWNTKSFILEFFF